MPKTKIRNSYQDEPGLVTMIWGDRSGFYEPGTVQHFWCWEADRGRDTYVRRVSDRNPGTLGAQVCDSLHSAGSTLTATPATLLSVIRREYRRHRLEYQRACADFYEGR